MSDDFLALFGERIHDEEDDEPRRQSPQGPVAARVVAALGRQCVVELPDGQQTVVEQNVFDHIEPGSSIPVFADADARWSLLDPRWELPDRPADPPSLVRGARVSFNIRAYDAALDALTGGVGKHEAFAPRTRLPWPACYPDVDLSQLIGRNLKLAVADPLDLRVELASQVHSASDGTPLGRLYSLRTLAKLKADVLVRVVSTEVQQFTVEFFGKYYQVFPEDRGWTRTGALLRGRLVEARLSVDMVSASVFLCLKCPYHPEWLDILRRYPVGTVIERARMLSATFKGLVLELPDHDLNVIGILPIYQLAPWAPWGQEDGYRTPPLPLQVIGHLDDRCALILGIEPYVAKRWRMATPQLGKRVPVHISRWSSLKPLVFWELGCQATATHDVDSGCAWGTVLEADATARRLVVEPSGTTRLGRGQVLGQNVHAIVFDDGSRAALARRIASSADDGILETALVNVNFGPDGTVLELVAQDESTKRVLDELERRCETQEPVPARVVERVKGGLMMDICTEALLLGSRLALAADVGIKPFLPNSQMDFTLTTNLEALVGATLDVEIIQFDRKTRKCIVSCRSREKRAESIQRLRIGEVMSGVVTNIIDYGAFVDLGGVHGLLHKTDLTYGHIKHPNEMLEVGQVINVKILKVDPDKQKVSLGLKQVGPDPWEKVETTYLEGEIVRGKVLKIQDYGAFVELEPGVEGLLHVSEMTWHEPTKHPSQLFHTGEIVDVKILDIDVEKRRIALGKKQLVPNTIVEVLSEVGGEPGPPLDPLRTRAGLIVSLNTLASRYAIPRADIGARFWQVMGTEVPPWDESLDLEVARRMVEALNSGQVPSNSSAEPLPEPPCQTSPPGPIAVMPKAISDPAASPLVLTDCGSTVSLWALSSRFGIGKDTLLALHSEIAPQTQPAWDQPLEPDVAKRIVHRLLKPIVRTSDADALHPVRAEQGACPPAPPPRPVPPTTPRGDGGRGKVPAMPGLDTLRRHLLARGTARPDEDDDKAPTETHQDKGEAGSSGATGDEVERRWAAWLLEGQGHQELRAVPLDARFAALAGLFDRHVSPGPLPSRERALAELAEAARALSDSGGAHTSPHLVDRILRCLAACPGDVLPWCVLVRAVPSQWLLDYANDVEHWARDHAIQRMDTPSMGRCIAVARAAVACGEMRMAHTTLGEWLRSADSIDLRRERSDLAERYRQSIMATSRFFDRWTRRLDCEVGRGSFAIVLPVIDDITGEKHALKHTLLLDALGTDQRASEALLGREARMLKDLLGLDGVPRFIDRPNSEVLVCEWIEGSTLAELLRHPSAAVPWTPQDIARLGRRLAEVLARVDERFPGFVHNDLAPRNVMVRSSRPEAAVLIDLGLAGHAERSVSSLIDDLDLELRAAYQAPEVREGSRGTSRGDMYSLGLMLLEILLSGEPMPVGPSAVQDSVARVTYGPRDAISRNLGGVLRHLLLPTADQRPSTWLAVAKRFAEVLDA